MPFNGSQINISQLDSSQLNSSQLDNSQLTMSQLDSSQLNASQLDNENNENAANDESKTKKRRRHRKEGESSPIDDSIVQNQTRSRIPKKNRTKEDDEALHRRYSRKEHDQPDAKDENVDPTSRRRRHRSPASNLHSTRRSEHMKIRSKGSEIDSRNDQKQTPHHGSIPVSARRITNSSILYDNFSVHKKQPIQSNTLSNLNDIVKNYQKIGNLTGKRSERNLSETEPIQQRKSSRRSESIDNLKSNDTKSGENLKFRSNQKKKILSSKFANSESFEKPKLLLQEKPLSIIASMNLEPDENKINSARSMHVTFEIDSQTLRKSKEKPKSKNPIQRPTWDEFPLRNLSKPKDSSRVAQLDNEYSLEKLMSELDAI